MPSDPNAESGELVFVDWNTLVFERLPRMLAIAAVVSVAYVTAVIVAARLGVETPFAVLIGFGAATLTEPVTRRLKTW
jgi:hypothetical protein